MYKSLLETLRQDMSKAPTEVAPMLSPEKPTGFMGAPKRKVEAPAPYSPIDYTRQGVSSVVAARKRFQEKLAKDTAKAIESTQAVAATTKRGFMTPPAEKVVEQEENAPLGTVINSEDSSGESVQGIDVNFGDYDIPEAEGKAAAQAIKNIESSGGNYQARGPVVAKGRYAGERALGAYQVMPGNLPQWSKAAIGREVSEEEFLKTPAIQDAVFMHQFNNSYKRYGSLEDAASVWFTGGPAKTAKGKSDGQMEAPVYIQKFNDHFNRILDV